ncbi:MAG TPA: sulfite exporter TauE/SafE family protein [Burkholderiaceae bacterium]
MNGALTLGAALLLGFAASSHCLVMCGGISAALGMAASKNAKGRTRLPIVMTYQLGRIFSYALAGLALAGIFGGLVSLLDVESVRRTLRTLSALALLLGALVAFGGLRADVGIGRTVWARLAPVGRRLLPGNSLPRGFAVGMVWGWMPCGFVYSVLLIAALQFDALNGALIMTAFGLGTAPALFIAACGAGRLGHFASRPAARHVAGSVLLVSALLTFAGPWVEHSLPGLHAWLPFDCRYP